jgi:hypothetical protein
MTNVRPIRLGPAFMQSGRTEQVISAAHSTPAHRVLLGLQLLAGDRFAGRGQAAGGRTNQ